MTTSEALPLSSILSSTLLGDVRGLGVVRPEPCSAIWLWKTQAAHVKHGKIVAVKPEAREGGLGCGPARQGEKVILYLAGCGYASNGPLLGPIAWSEWSIISLQRSLKSVLTDAFLLHFSHHETAGTEDTRSQ